MVTEWDGTKPLFTEPGLHRTCPRGPHTTERNVLCPFGFWGIRYAIEQLSRTDKPVIASGGVSSLDDLRALATLVPEGLEGAIVGKALVEGRFSVEEGIAACAVSV